MGLLSWGNRNVSQVWFVFLVAWVALMAVGWKAFVAIEDIDTQARAIAETEIELLR